MAVTDFLSGGTIPAGSAVTDVTTTTALPDWYTNYGQQLLANQGALSSQGYNPAFNKQLAGFAPAQEAAFGQVATGSTSFMPGLEQAGQTTQGALQQSAMGAAQPYLGAAAQTAPQVIQNYMNPYTDQVANRIGQLGLRTLNETLLPGISDKMVAAGQFGGTRQAELMGRALRDTMEGISAQQTSALQQGYGQGLTAAQTDLARQGTLANVAGGLAGTDVTNQLAGAAQQSAQAQQLQNQTLAGANALQQTGALQQNLNQQNLDANQQNALAQQSYLQNQINAGLNTLGGVSKAVPTTSTQAGIQPIGYPSAYPSSTAANIASGLAGAAGLVKTIASI